LFFVCFLCVVEEQNTCVVCAYLVQAQRVWSARWKAEPRKKNCTISIAHSRDANPRDERGRAEINMSCRHPDIATPTLHLWRIPLEDFVQRPLRDEADNANVGGWYADYLSNLAQPHHSEKKRHRPSFARRLWDVAILQWADACASHTVEVDHRALRTFEDIV